MDVKLYIIKEPMKFTKLLLHNWHRLHEQHKCVGRKQMCILKLPNWMAESITWTHSSCF